MARKETIEIEAKINSKEVEKEFENIDKSVKEATESASEFSDKTSEGLTKIEKQSVKANKSTKNLGKGFNVLGGAMKAAGIGLIVAVVAKLTQAFSQNQAVMDAVNKVFTTVNIVFQQVTTAITNAFKSTSEATGGFEKTISVIKGLIKIGLTPLILTFKTLKLGFQQAQLLWERSFLGDGNPETIKELRKNIDETKQSIKETGKEALQAGKDVATNFTGMISEVSDFASEAANNVKNVSISAARESANAIVDLRKQVQLGEAQLQGLTLEFQKQAEVLRQDRDDTRLSIDERIKANEKLGEVLQKQLDAELRIANQKVNLAKQELALNGESVEAQVALQEALNGVSDIQERITGQASEQRVNEAALQQERKDNLAELRLLGLEELERQKIESENEFERQKQLIEVSAQNEEQKNRLIEAAKKDHLERVKAIEAEDEAARQEKFLEQLEVDKEFDALQFEEKRSLLLERLDMLKADELLSEQQKNEEKKKLQQQLTKVEDTEAKKREQIEQGVANAKRNIAMRGLALVAEIAGKGSKIAKAVGIAQATFSAIEGAQNAFTTAAKSPITTLFPAYPFVQAGLAAGFGALQVSKIASAQTPSVSASGGVSGGGAGSAAAATANTTAAIPNFDVVGDTGQNQIASSLNEVNSRPQRSYVVSSEMQSQEQLDRNIQADASLD